MPLLHSKILGNGEPLLILHGFFGMGDNWKSLGNTFAEKYEVHLIDQRNHGRSFHSDEFSYEVMVEDLFNYIKHHQIDYANFLGHSMGGKTVMLFAMTYPEFVNRLIVADIAPRFYPRHHDIILAGLNAIDFTNLRSRNEIDKVLEDYIPEF
ncbi:MAG: alpha/beta fold hydrolase, partial [Flavobacteriaceae bacterium]|nr:alpha/beta fold hydrolase [Flavobacteriaceae bacterium]